MSYTPIDIPFVTGQDQSFDRKILPVGPLHRVENAYQERTGRMAKRLGDQARPTTDLEGNDWNTDRYVASLPNDRVLAFRPELGSTAAISFTPEDRANQQFDFLAGWGFRTQINAGSVEDGDRITNPGQSHSPSVALTSNVLVFAYLVSESAQGTQHTAIDIYDRDTLRLIRSIRSSDGTGLHKEIKVVARPTHPDFAVIVKAPVDPNTNIYVRRYENESANESNSVVILDVLPDSTFDATMDANNVGSFHIVYANTSQQIIAQGVRIEDLVFGTPRTTTPSPAIDEDYTVLCGGASFSTSEFFFGASYRDTNGDYFTRIAHWSGGINASQIPADTAITAPCMALRLSDNFLVLARGHGSQTQVYLVDKTATAGSPRFAELCFPVGSAMISRLSENSDNYGWIPMGESPRGAAGEDGAPPEPEAFEDSRGSVALINIDPGFNGNGHCAGVLLRAGGSDISRVEVSNTIGGPNRTSRINKWTPAHTVEWLQDGRGMRIVCLEQRISVSAGRIPEDDPDVDDPEVRYANWRTQCGFVVLGHEEVPNNIFGIPWDREDTIISGSGLSVLNDSNVHFAGFSGAPRVTVTQTQRPNPLPPGTYQYICILEYRDVTGRLWRSLPSDPVAITTTADNTPTVRAASCAGFPHGSSQVIYRTVEGGSNFFRINFTFGSDDFVSDEDLIKGEPPYIAGAVLANDPPPAARFIARTRDRIWAGGLDFPARVQVSKFIRPTEGVHWSNRDNFFIDMPEAVTGLSAMDDALVVFSRNQIYLVSGDGPTDQGAGSYPPARTVPSDIGCVSANSIILAGPGVFFLSRRGIELLNRGFSTPAFIGDPVRDITDAHPHCLGVVLMEEQKQVRWLMSDRENSPDQSTAIIVYDLRVQAWYVYRSGVAHTGMGNAKAGAHGEDSLVFPRDGMVLYRSTMGLTTRETLAPGSLDQIWETGELRPAGMMGGAYGRRINIMGTYQGDSVIKIEMAFNDAADFHPTFVKEWTLDAASGYTVGSPVVLELTLPVQKFWAVRFRVTASGDSAGFDANGITVFFDTEGGGPRVGARSKG